MKNELEGAVMNQSILQLKNIHKSFPGVKALDNACLNVYAGRVMELMGENGAGKSTLMKVLTGIYTLDEGEIFYKKENHSGSSDKEVS